MKAIIVKEFGGPEQLLLTELPDLSLRSEEDVVVDVHCNDAASTHRHPEKASSWGSNARA
jgi:NADPH:quinone reductase-like Zn-dependent oxidoreductase